MTHNGSGTDAVAHGLWIFGYGSLMWRPDFDYAEASRARLEGWHRAFCISSVHHRGNAERPGLVLGLDRGGACEGVAYRVAPERVDETLRYLRRRELVNGVYCETRVAVTLRGSEGTHHVDGRIVQALAYTVERAHPSYVGRLPLSIQAHQIRGARGLSGDNLDYLIATVLHMRDMGIREPQLERLVALAAPHAANRMDASFVTPSATPIRLATRHHPDRARRMRRGDRMRFLYRMRLGGA